MKFVRNITWQEVFEIWRKSESMNPEWILCATQKKGWESWELWRKYSASQIYAEYRTWKLFECNNPMNEIPAMLLGPYTAWQSQLEEKNKISFKDFLDIPKQMNKWKKNKKVSSLSKEIPFSTEFIGIVREDNKKIVCLEGHHRAMAFALAKKTRERY
jgi:hypothetical protein